MALLGLSCLLRWVLTSLGASRESGTGRFDADALPDRIIEKILHKLPVDQVLRCRAVCRRWQHLIDDPKFAVVADPGKHPSVMAFQCVRPYTRGMEGDNEFGLYIIGTRPSEPLTKGGIKRMPLGRVEVPDEILMDDGNTPVIRGSCGGLIIFGGLYLPTRYFICNPVTQESVKLGGEIADMVYGFYFHPSREEYRLLCAGRRADHQFGYYTCDLRGESRNELGLYPYGPGEDLDQNGDLATSPLIVGGSLYSMLQYIDPASMIRSYTIMALDLDTEELQFKRPPKSGHSYLFEAEGRLCFFCRDHMYRTFEVWSLQHRASWSWIKRFSIKVALPEPSELGYSYNVQPLLIINGRELILYWKHWGLVRCDVGTGKLENIIELKAETGLACFPVASCSMSLYPLSRLCL